MKQMNVQGLAQLSLRPLQGWVRRWWYRRMERHFVISAEVESAKASEHMRNAAYYHKRAAIARASQL